MSETDKRAHCSDRRQPEYPEQYRSAPAGHYHPQPHEAGMVPRPEVGGASPTYSPQHREAAAPSSVSMSPAHGVSSVGPGSPPVYASTTGFVFEGVPVPSNDSHVTNPGPFAVTPPGLKLGERQDYVVLQKRNVVMVVMVLIGLLFTIGAGAAAVVEFGAGTVVTLIIVLLATIGICYFAVEQEAVFHHSAREFRLERRRLLLAPCNRGDITERWPFAELGSVSLEIGNANGQPGASICSVYLQTPTANVRLYSEVLYREADQHHLLFTWRSYVDQLRPRAATTRYSGA